jgi:hypothetical protein
MLAATLRTVVRFSLLVAPLLRSDCPLGRSFRGPAQRTLECNLGITSVQRTHLRVETAMAGVRRRACIALDLREQKRCSIEVKKGIADVVVAHCPHQLHCPERMSASQMEKMTIR